MRTETIKPLDLMTPGERAAHDARHAVVAIAEATERLRKAKRHASAGVTWEDYCERLGLPKGTQRRFVRAAREMKPRLDLKGDAHPEAVAEALPGWIATARDGLEALDDDAGFLVSLAIRAIDASKPPRPESRDKRLRRQVYGHTYPAALHDTLQALTRARTQGRELASKRPHVGLRFEAGGYRVALSPQLESSAMGWTPADVIRADVFTTRDGQGVIKADLLPGGVIQPRQWRANEEQTLAAFAALVTALETLEANPGAALAGSDHCAVCGRVLTDEHSRARGIGPECEALAAWAFELFTTADD